MLMIFKRYSRQEVQLFTRRVVWVDIAINISAGVLLGFAPQLANRLLFDAAMLPGWLVATLGAGFLLFAVWQLLVFVRPGGFSVQNLRFAAWLAWVPVLALSLGLLSSTGRQLVTAAKVFLWTANGYMVLLGGLYWGMAEKIAKEC